MTIKKYYWLNGATFDTFDLYIKLFGSLSGISNFFFNLLLKKLEVKNNIKLFKFIYINQNKKLFCFIYSLLRRSFPKFFSYNALSLFNIVRLRYIRSYGGYCHGRGKPVRGQRTWSNAWTSYKCNILYRNFRIEASKTRELRKLFKIKKLRRRHKKAKKLTIALIKSTHKHKKSGRRSALKLIKRKDVWSQY